MMAVPLVAPASHPASVALCWQLFSQTYLTCWHTLGEGVHVITVGGADIVIRSQGPDHACADHSNLPSDEALQAQVMA